MKYSELYKGGFLKAADLQGKVHRWTIKSVRKQALGDDDREKAILRFEEIDQELPLAPINATTLYEAFKEDDIADWIGNVILVRPDKCDFRGKRVDCIRVEVPPVKKVKKTPGPVVAEEEDDDDVPV